MADDRTIGACGGIGFGGCQWIWWLIIIFFIILLIFPVFFGVAFI